MSSGVLAADASVISPTSSLLRMILGLAVVLAVMALLAWLLKRMLPSVGGQQSVVRVVGAVSVGSRERVVVVEVAGRWIVVGVAPGHVTGIANLDKGTVNLAEQDSDDSVGVGGVSASNSLSPALNAFTQPFTLWLKKSSAKFTEKKDV